MEHNEIKLQSCKNSYILSFFIFNMIITVIQPPLQTNQQIAGGVHQYLSIEFVIDDNVHSQLVVHPSWPTGNLCASTRTSQTRLWVSRWLVGVWLCTLGRQHPGIATELRILPLELTAQMTPPPGLNSDAGFQVPGTEWLLFISLSATALVLLISNLRNNRSEWYGSSHYLS